MVRSLFHTRRLVNPIARLATISLLVVTGCSSIWNNYPQPIFIDTKNQKEIKATVISAEKTYTVTLPTVIEEQSSYTGVTIVIKDNCYTDETYEVGKSIDSSYIHNIWNIYGLLIDLPFGFIWDYDERITVSPTRNLSCR